MSKTDPYRPSLFDDGTIHSIREFLLARHETVAVAESVTSGLVQAALSTADDAISFYQGGITTYNLGQKSRHLHIEPVHALKCNCVSEKVAAEMAVNVCRLFSSDWGIAITGYATPVPESGNALYAFYAIAAKDKVMAVGKIQPDKEAPFGIQVLYARQVLKHLRDCLEAG